MAVLAQLVAILLGLLAILPWMLHDLLAWMVVAIVALTAWTGEGGPFAVAALLRPCCVTTDDTGIGVTTWHGSQSLRWKDIRFYVAIRHPYTHGGHITLVRGEYDGAEISLWGYASDTADRLIKLICRRVPSHVLDGCQCRDGV